MKNLLFSLAMFALASNLALAQGTTGRSDTAVRTDEEGLAVYTATRYIESNATSVRVYARGTGEKEKGCIDNKPNGFFDQVIQNANNFFENIFVVGSPSAKARAEAMSKTQCAAVVAQLKIVVDGVETEIGKFQDYDFDSFDQQL